MPGFYRLQTSVILQASDFQSHCRCSGVHPWDDGSHKDDPKQLQAIWNALCKGDPAPLIPHKHPRGAHGKGDEAEDSKLLAVMETARVEKHVKSRLAVAADHFNRDYKKGFQFLQVIYCSVWLIVTNRM